ncbi:MAG: hypothetical protein AAFX02_01880 [Pseudomonadota bacterium]
MAISIGCAILVLLTAHLATTGLGHITGITEGFGLLPLFNFDAEQNIPTFFSVVLILMSAAFVFLSPHRTDDRKTPPRWITWVITAALIFVALDEFASVHERIGGSLALILPTSGIFHHAWLIPYLALCAIFAPTGWVWLRSHPIATQAQIALAAGIFLTGAVGMEMVAGILEAANLTPSATSTLSFFAMTLEELLEMSGMAVFLLATFTQASNMRDRTNHKNAETI